MPKYISHFPPPLLDDLVTGKWLPVVGAGMSLNASVPNGKKMPLWGDLGKALGDELVDFSPSGTLDAISAYEHEYGRARLIERLSDLLLIREAQSGAAHKEFCTLPFDIVCTTNFDFLLERQYDLTPKYVYPVVDEEQLSINTTGTAGTLLLKLHGDLHHPARLIVSESDYDGFLAKYPLLATFLSNQLITKTAMFIGYSLDDPDFRQIWHIVSNRLGRSRRMAYTLAVGASSTDVTRFERRGVKLINLPGDRKNYGKIFAATFAELREYMRDNVIRLSKVTDEKPLQQLLLPRDAVSRLCFFAVPLDLLPFYRENVFPLVEAAGFVPVSADEVVSPGDSVSAKLDSLIDRASVMIIEMSTSWTRAEFRMAVARLRMTPKDQAQKNRLHLILVVTDAEQTPPSAQNYLIISRPTAITEASENFLGDLSAYLANIAGDLGLGRSEEPARLLESGEYRAAVISAMSLLESKLRELLEKRQWNEVQRPMSLLNLVTVAQQHLIASGTQREVVRNWIHIRNQAIHTSGVVTRNAAQEIVTGVHRMISELSNGDTGLP